MGAAAKVKDVGGGKGVCLRRDALLLAMVLDSRNLESEADLDKRYKLEGADGEE